MKFLFISLPNQTLFQLEKKLFAELGAFGCIIKQQQQQQSLSLLTCQVATQNIFSFFFSKERSTQKAEENIVWFQFVATQTMIEWGERCETRPFVDDFFASLHVPNLFSNESQRCELIDLPKKAVAKKYLSSCKRLLPTDKLISLHFRVCSVLSLKLKLQASSFSCAALPISTQHKNNKQSRWALEKQERKKADIDLITWRPPILPLIYPPPIYLSLIQARIETKNKC